MGKKKTPLKKHLMIAGFAAYFLFVLVSLRVGFTPGRRVGAAFCSFGLQMLQILPCAFILISLFEVWVKTETVEKYLGEKSGARGYLSAILLASTIVGGLYVSLPLAYSLHKKGARLGIIFTYISASAVCRVPMSIFEASFLGIRFTAVRLLVSLPLIVISSVLLERYLTRQGYALPQGE